MTLAAIGVLTALALMAPAAQAQDDAFGAAACVLVPGSVSGNTALQDVSNDAFTGGSWEPTGLLDTDTGSFTFGGPAVCAGADVAGNPGSTPDALAGVFDIDASGTFVNLICGTGSANGTARLGDIDMTFAITFAAGVGQLSIVVDRGTARGALGTLNTVSGGSGAGVIDIAPVQGSCLQGGVNGFVVNGGFYLSLSGDAQNAPSPAPVAPAAPAQGGDDTFAVAECVLVPGSVAGTGTPIRSVEADRMADNSWEPTELLDTGSGTFTFSGPAVCAGADVAGNTGSTPDALAGVFDIDASGTFVNLICGTGSANGTARLGDIDMTFAITFAAGVGQLSIVVDGGVAVGALGTSNTISGGSGAGVIDIAPAAGSCLTGPGVAQWLVNGAFAATLQG